MPTAPFVLNPKSIFEHQKTWMDYCRQKVIRLKTGPTRMPYNFKPILPNTSKDSKKSNGRKNYF